MVSPGRTTDEADIIIFKFLKLTDEMLGVQYNTIQLYCLYVEKFAFWLVIYIKTFNTVNNKTSTTGNGVIIF